MKKYLVLAFIVTWSGQPLRDIVPCPNASPLVDQKSSISYVSACIGIQAKQETKEFKTKKEAEEFAQAIRTLIDSKVQVKAIK